VKNCKIRKFDVPKGLVRWVPKAHLTLLDPSLTAYQNLKFNLYLQVCLASNNLLWYLDSGCSKHMTGDASQLTNLKLRPAGYVTYGDNNRGRILGVGNIGEIDKVIIKDVLLVERLKHNLLSISQPCDKGYKITFEPNLCLITDSKSTETVLVGKRVNNVYMLNVSCITSSMNCLLTRNDESWL